MKARRHRLGAHKRAELRLRRQLPFQVRPPIHGPTQTVVPVVQIGDDVTDDDGDSERDSDDEKAVIEPCCAVDSSSSDSVPSDDDVLNDEPFITPKFDVDQPDGDFAEEYQSAHLNRLSTSADWRQFHDEIADIPIAAEFQKSLVCQQLII